LLIVHGNNITKSILRPDGEAHGTSPSFLAGHGCCLFISQSA
jgi:hypothetical protein